MWRLIILLRFVPLAEPGMKRLVFFLYLPPLVFQAGIGRRSGIVSLISSSTLARVVDGVVQLFIISVRSSTTLSSLSSKSSSGYNGFLSINFFDFFECVVLNAHWRFRHE